MTRFDPIPDQAYGLCADCKMELMTKEDAEAHMDETMASSGRRRQSHTIRATNPERERRIQSFVDGVVRDAIDDAMDELQNPVSRDLASSEEIEEALKWFGTEWSDAWNRRGE